MWNDGEITYHLGHLRLGDDQDTGEASRKLRRALIVAVEGLGLQEEYREEALGKITKILGVPE